MQTETTAQQDQTINAPAPQADIAAPSSPPANGQDGNAPVEPKLDNPADGQDESGKQQDADQAPGDRDEQGRFKSKVQRRIDELTHARHTAEREAARWRAIAEGKQAAAAPQPHEFASDEDYEAAARRHEIREAAREIASDNAKQAAEQYQQDAQRAVAETYAQRVEAAAVRIPDFVDVMDKADIPISNSLRDALMDSEHGPDIAYQLAKKPAEAQRLSKLDDRALYREIGRMEAGMLNAMYPPAAAQAAPAAPAARITSAPPPAATVGPGGAPANTDPARMSQAEFEAWFKAQGSKYM